MGGKREQNGLVLYKLPEGVSPIAHAGEIMKPRKCFAMFSGGNDSLVTTHHAMTIGAAQEVLHINTGIGIAATREFVRDTCRSFGWPLKEVHPPELDYRGMVLKYGFPGPGAHLYPYSWLKERALMKVVRETKQKVSDRVFLITGVRSKESARRMGFVQPIIRQGARVWIASHFDFSKLDVFAYIKRHALKINPVTRIIGMSGECLCGAFAKPKELITIDKHFPEVGKQIHDLQDEAAASGVRDCIWGVRPRKNRQNYDLPFMPMCAGCSYRPEAMG